MNYELVTAVVVGAPTTNQDGLTRNWYYNVTSNVVGNTYPQFYHSDTDVFTFNVTDTQIQIQDKLTAAAQAYIVANYPNV